MGHVSVLGDLRWLSQFAVHIMLAVINNGELCTYNLVHDNAAVFGSDFVWLGF